MPKPGSSSRCGSVRREDDASSGVGGLHRPRSARRERESRNQGFQPMPVYQYTAIEADGAKRSGKLSSASPIELGDALKRSGLYLLNAHEQRAGPRSSCPRTLPPKVLSDLTERLEILVKAGFPLADALHQIALD